MAARRGRAGVRGLTSSLLMSSRKMVKESLKKKEGVGRMNVALKEGKACIMDQALIGKKTMAERRKDQTKKHV